MEWSRALERGPGGQAGSVGACSPQAGNMRVSGRAQLIAKTAEQGHTERSWAQPAELESLVLAVCPWASY